MWQGGWSKKEGGARGYNVTHYYDDHTCVTILKDDINYFQEIEPDLIPQKHIVNPEYATKKCSSSLELDATVSAILNVKFINVNCNPGLK